MLESSMRQIVVKALKPLDAISVENSARAGTPDVNFIEGWIELKVLESWPARKATPVKVPCYTPQQRVWARRRAAMGGRVYFLIRIGSDWLLFLGDEAARRIGKMNKEEMIEQCLLHCPGSLDTKAFYKAVSGA